jgi:hypothetical protein
MFSTSVPPMAGTFTVLSFSSNALTIYLLTVLPPDEMRAAGGDGGAQNLQLSSSSGSLCEKSSRADPH